jgi:hypothetical protein
MAHLYAPLINNKHKLYVDYLDNDINNNLNNILKRETDGNRLTFLNCIIEDKNVFFKSYDFSIEDEISRYDGFNNDIIDIIKLGKTYFDKAGLPVDQYTGRITFTSCLFDNDPIIKDSLNISCDNEEIMGHNCLFYTHKDFDVKNCDLDYYFNYQSTFCSDNTQLPCRLPILTNLLTIYDGDLMHTNPIPGGNGIFNYIHLTLSTPLS